MARRILDIARYTTVRHATPVWEPEGAYLGDRHQTFGQEPDTLATLILVVIVFLEEIQDLELHLRDLELLLQVCEEGDRRLLSAAGGHRM